MGQAGSSNSLNLEPTVLAELWAVDDRIRCYDMESGGFGLVCKSEMGRQWLVVRGISDYGTPDSKKEEHRFPAALSAALFLRLLLESGLVECHPNYLRPPESAKTELSQENFFTRFNVTAVIGEAARTQLEIDLSRIDLGSSLALDDYEAILVGRGADREAARNLLTDVREQYFTDKYLEYGYEYDLRGLIPNWTKEVRSILSGFLIDLNSSTVLDVGIGNGLEVPGLLDGAELLIGVDVSEKSLERAKALIPSLTTIHSSAEDLRDVRTKSIDVYVSLRTYQSSLFDFSQALREAQRALRPRGVIVLSVANGFVDQDGDAKKVVRGLLVPGSRRIVDRGTPRRFADRIIEKLIELGFEEVGYSSAKTDIYIWGQRA